MTTCAVSRPLKKAQSAGYTLIELMVVIAIIGLLTSFVLPYIPSDKTDRMRSEVDRFESLVSYAQTQAILQSQDFGLMVEGDTYSFMQQDEAGAWETMSEEPLNPQKLDDYLTQTLFYEEAEVEPDPFQAEIVPTVLLFSSGEVTPFDYKMALSEQQFTLLKFNLLGEVERESVDESQ